MEITVKELVASHQAITIILDCDLLAKGDRRSMGQSLRAYCWLKEQAEAAASDMHGRLYSLL